MTYAAFRQQIITDVMVRQITPLDVAQRLSEHAHEYREIDAVEIAELRRLGTRWDGRRADAVVVDDTDVPGASARVVEPAPALLLDALPEPPPAENEEYVR